MTDGYFVNLNIGIAGLMISMLGLMQVLVSVHFERWMKKLFIAIFGIMVAIAVFNLTGQSASAYPDLTHARIFRFTLFWESFLPSLLMLLLTAFLLWSTGESDLKKSWLFRTVAALWIVYVGLLIYTQFSTVIYSIDDSNVYRRGPLYPLLLVPPALIMAADAIFLWRRRNRLSARQLLAFGIYIAFPLISMLVQMFFYGLYTILLGSSIAVVFMFNYIWADQSERYYQQVQENKQLRVEIMLSQIQPHFLYNTLGAIQSLCKTDPAAAEKAVATFSKYLRGNMDSLSEDRTITFSQELAHTRLYLELEQLRYEDALRVFYDLDCTEFRIPTLTLQPLVENAVRHGVRGNPDGRGSVRISSREFADRYEVTVSDDGPGFNPARELQADRYEAAGSNNRSGFDPVQEIRADRYKVPVSDDGPGLTPARELQDGRSHIGLANVRERLRRVAGGSLRIDSAPGAGTRAVIMIPKTAKGAD